VASLRERCSYLAAAQEAASAEAGSAVSEIHARLAESEADKDKLCRQLASLTLDLKSKHDSNESRIQALEVREFGGEGVSV
jgi:Flp pilus assembly protein CpaB